jgi:hypothetical protein
VLAIFVFVGEEENLLLCCQKQHKSRHMKLQSVSESVYKHLNFSPMKKLPVLLASLRKKSLRKKLSFLIELIILCIKQKT